MADFISQGFFETGGVLPEDALGHDALALRILDRVRSMDPGSGIAIQASWGHGKTDVLARMAASTYGLDQKLDASRIAPKALWLNPWQYDDPNLLTPLVIALLGRIPKEFYSKGK